jgi:hypothetical protein
VAGEPQPQIDIHKAVSRLFFIIFLFLSSFDETMIELGLDAEGLTKTLLHLNLGFICFVLFWILGVFLFFPLWRDNDRTSSQTPTPGPEAKGLTPKVLRLKHYCS